MAQKYKTGDVVLLKSGSPKMTVKMYFRSPTVRPGTGEVSEVLCQWFAGSKQEQGSFPEDSLQLYETEDQGTPRVR